jgi:hypothetical protein
MQLQCNLDRIAAAEHLISTSHALPLRGRTWPGGRPVPSETTLVMEYNELRHTHKSCHGSVDRR